MATNKYIIQLIVDTGSGQAKVKGVAKAFEDLDKAAKKTNTALKDTKKAFDDGSSAAGIAGSTVTEFGRLVSDLPYGIQGVANNLSQLGSMFSLLVVQASKMNNKLSTSKNVFNLIKEQVMGPVGVLVLFQGLVAAMEYFSKRTKEANEELKEFNDQLIFQGKAASDFLSLLEDENVANEKKRQIVMGLVSANKDLKKAIDAGGDPLKVTLKHLKNLNEEFKIRERLLSLEEKFSDEYKNINPTRELYLKNQKRINEITTGQAKITGRAAAVTLEGLEKQNKAIKAILDLRVEEAALISRRNQLFEEPFEFLDVDFSFFDADSAFEFEESFIAKLQEISDKTRGFFKFSDVFEPEPYFPFIDPDDVEMEAEIDEYFKKIKEKFDEKQKKLADTAKTIDTITKGLNAINDVLNAQSERELTIEKNKTTAKNDELKKRLANEQLSADQRDKVNQQIARNDAALVEKQNEIARKQFKRNKAFKIAMAIGETASSAIKAYSSQLLPFDPTSVGRATIAAAIATAFGLAQVAAISKTKYSETPMPTPNLTSQGGGAATTAAPDFNVIGGSGRSQLAEAIAGTRNEPIKAYVVSSEVSSAQELDRKIVAGASI